jgi:hypothetical protein
MEIRADLGVDERGVLADWLCARGDPRGELLNLELALDDAAPGPARTELAARLASLRAELEPRWVEELAAALSLSVAQLHEVMPGRWYAGMLLEAALRPVGVHANTDAFAQLLGRILDSEAAAALEVLDLGELDPEGLIVPLCARPRERLRRLVLGNERFYYDSFRAERFDALPALRELELRGLGLGELELPQLQRLYIFGGSGHVHARQLSERSWPALESLVLHGDFVQPASDWVAQLVGADAMPALRELALLGVAVDVELLDALLASPVFARLRRLSLSGGTLTSLAIRALRERADEFAHLVRLDMRDIEMTGIEALTAGTPLDDALPMLNCC